jgi:hypothetical protein
MSAEEIRELWSRFLAGEELSPETQKGLVDALDADPELRASLLENLQLDGILHSMSTTRREGDAFVRNLADCLGPERDATRFIRKVESRLNENPPPTWTPPSTGRKAKKDTTRVFRRRSQTSPSGETAWKPALIAAAAFIAILLLVVAEFKSPPPIPVVKAPVPGKSADTESGKRDVPPPNQKATPEKRLEELRIEETALLTIPSTPEEKPEDREKKLVANEEERRAIEAELAKRIPVQLPVPPDPKNAPKQATIAAPPASVTPTVVERVAGNVYLARSAGEKRRAKKDDVVPVGWNVETPGAGSSVTLRFSDRTSVEVGPNSYFREVAAPTAVTGRQVYLALGTLESQITKQPVERPMIFGSPWGEATILGTTIRLVVSNDRKLGTTLEVQEGRVLLTRLLDKKSVEVVTGQFAVAATGVDPVPQRSFPDEVLVKFGPTDVKLQPTWVLDSGEEFDAKRGYGWIGPKNGPPVPGIKWRNPTTREWEQKYAGRVAVRRTATATADELKTTDVTAGWAKQSETWVMPIPNGRYLISVCCGDPINGQGPHHVWVEGAQIVDGRLNRIGESIEVKDVLVEVRDGELTMKVGGYTGTKVSSDGSTDTMINYLLIKRVRK